MDYHLSYEHLRESGIRSICSKLIGENDHKKDVLERIQRFARYSDENEAKMIIAQVESYEPDKYEAIYHEAIRLRKDLISIKKDISQQSQINSIFVQYKACVDLLYPSHKEPFLEGFKRKMSSKA